jgi:hypothetical protein
MTHPVAAMVLFLRGRDRLMALRADLVFHVTLPHCSAIAAAMPG